MRLTGFSALLLACLVLPLCAQIDNGNITGRVTDKSGAVVPHAKVTVTQTEMNFQTVLDTNDEGFYRASSLRPGPYKISILAQGFKTFVRESLVLPMNETIEVNATLEVGATTESIDVLANVEMLQTETSSTGALMEGSFWYDLPNFQRWVSAVPLYTPGTSFSGLAYTGSLGGEHINGGPTAAISVFEDGALGTVGDGNSVDSLSNSIDEIKVLTTTLPAEYGHSAGGAISVVKKSGTNQLHGLASDFGRTRRMQERKYFDQYTLTQGIPGANQPAGLISTEPDWMLSGPVYIPHIYNGKNKTFFTFGAQLYIEKQSKQQVSSVPSLAELGGDFTFPNPAQGNTLIGQAIYDPATTAQSATGAWSRSPFPGNIIPQNRFSNLANKVLSLDPYLAPNTAGSMSTTGPASNIYTEPMKVFLGNTFTGRLDQQITDKIKAYGSSTYNSRYQRQPLWTVPQNSFFDTSLDISHNGQPYQSTWSAGNTWLASATLVNDMRASYYRENQPVASVAYGQDYSDKLGISGLPNTCMPSLGSFGFTEAINHACPSGNLQEIITLKDDVSKVWHNHAFKFGYELMRYRQDSWSVGSPDGTFTFAGTAGVSANGVNVANTGNTFANFLLGGVSSVAFSKQLQTNLPRNWQHSLYAQDDWKVTPALTLNIGLRYEMETPPVQKYGLLSVFDPTAPDTSQYTNYTCNGCVGAYTHPAAGTYPYNMQWNRLDPRFGLSWHPLNKMVFRGGFGMNHLDMRTSDLDTDELFTLATTISQAPGNPTPLFYTNQGVPAFSYPALRADSSVPYAGNAGGHSASIVEKRLKAPYNLTWNFGIEYQVSQNYLITLQYMGSAESQVLGSYDLNTLPFGIIPNPNVSCSPTMLATQGYAACGTMNLNDPANAAYRTSWLANPQVSRPWNNWGTISMDGNDGHSDHNEGTIKFEKRYSKGLNFQVFYTLARTMTWSPGAEDQYLPASLFKTRAAFDQRQAFTGTMTYEIPFGKGRHWMNRGGLWNLIAGGYNLVWTSSIYSGQPAGISIAGSPYSSQEYPSYMSTYGSALMLKMPALRNDWQDLGGNRFTQAAQNSTLNCGFDNSFVASVGNSCMQIIGPFSQGNNNAELFSMQRIIAATASLSKVIPLKERMNLQLRVDFQNPFKWYNWGALTTSLNVANLANSKTFGTVASGNEGTTAAYGGEPLINATIAIKF